MAKVILEVPFESITGTPCPRSRVIFRRRYGRLHCYRKRKVGKTYTDNERANHQRFKEASDFYKSICADSEQLRLYQERFAAQSKFKQLRHLIISDYFNNTRKESTG